MQLKPIAMGQNQFIQILSAIPMTKSCHANSKCSKVIHIFNSLQWLPVLAARLALGVIFFQSGTGKFKHLDGVITYFSEMHIPYANIQAPMVAGFEVVFGAALVLGLFTRLAAMPLIGVMVVAILSAYPQESKNINSLIRLDEFFYIIILLWLVVGGAGAVSLDRIFCRREKKVKED